MSWIMSLVRPELSGIKPYVPGKPIDEVKRELGLETVVKLASNENPYKVPDAVLEAAKRALSEMHRYPDAASYHLVRAIAKKLGVSPDEVIVGNGSEYIIDTLMKVFVSPGDEVVYAVPSFVVYRIAASVMGAKRVEVPCKDYRHDLEAMAEAITDKTKLVFVCNPNNPTGTIVRRDELDQFFASVEGKRLLVVMDEAYFEYAKDPNYPDGLQYFRRYGNVVVLRTFSKIYGLAGLRIGYGIAPKEIVSIYNTIREVFAVNVVAQAAALAALKEDAYVSWVSMKVYEEKKKLYEALSKMGLPYVESEANFVLIKVRDSKLAFEEMLKRGVVVRPTDSFDLPNHIRVTVGTPEENEVFLKALKELLPLLR